MNTNNHTPIVLTHIPGAVFHILITRRPGVTHYCFATSKHGLLHGGQFGMSFDSIDAAIEEGRKWWPNRTAVVWSGDWLHKTTRHYRLQQIVFSAGAFVRNTEAIPF
jgi:hypothetical protein